MERLITKEQLSKYLGVSIGTINNMISKRKITYVRVGRQVRFRQKDIDKFIINSLIN